jgi:DNA-binding response OmpR family regulator
MAFPGSDSESLPSAIGLRSSLIVTASAATRLMYAEYLAWRGVSVREVTGAAAALDHLSAFTPDVVVIEEKLEDAKGVDLILTLRRSQRTCRIPIALLSTDVFGMTPVRAHRFGCDLLIPVPCLPDTLLDALVQLVHDGATSRDLDVMDSWLFVRDGESVRIARRADLELTISGPGWQRGAYRFSSELELSMFQADHEQRLVNAGFTFEAFRHDRRGGNDRHPEFKGPERRLAPARDKAAGT